MSETNKVTAKKAAFGVTALILAFILGILMTYGYCRYRYDFTLKAKNTPRNPRPTTRKQ